MKRARMKDRIERLIRKNALALGEPVKVRAVYLRDGRVRMDWRKDAELSETERQVEPRTYPSLESAYRAALVAHLRAHRIMWRERAA